jgi:hypothetical protein
MHRRFILQVAHQFRLQKPLISVHYLASDKALKLEYDQAHIAVRSGPKPEQPDNIEQPLVEVILALYAHESYVARRGLPAAKAEYKAHTLGCWQTTNSYARFPFTKWFANNVPAYSIALQTEHQHIAEQAVLLDISIGFFPIHEERKHPELIQVPLPQDD